jgi:transcriptional antiterminator RfaH
MTEPTYHLKRWLAFYIRFRHEKKVAERLCDSGIEVFCPLVCVKVRWSDCWKKVQKPVINGYLSVRLTEAIRSDVLEFKYINSLI